MRPPKKKIVTLCTREGVRFFYPLKTKFILQYPFLLFCALYLYIYMLKQTCAPKNNNVYILRSADIRTLKKYNFLFIYLYRTKAFYMYFFYIFMILRVLPFQICNFYITKILISNKKNKKYSSWSGVRI